MNNDFFKQLLEKEVEYAQKKEEIENRATAALEEKGADSAEYRQCYEDIKALGEYPVPAGAKKACYAESMTCHNKSSEFEMPCSLWNDEVEDFVKTLREAGVETFAYTDISTGLLETIHRFLDAGCVMDAPCTVTRTEQDANGDEKTTDHFGIRFFTSKDAVPAILDLPGFMAESSKRQDRTEEIIKEAFSAVIALLSPDTRGAVFHTTTDVAEILSSEEPLSVIRKVKDYQTQERKKQLRELEKVFGSLDGIIDAVNELKSERYAYTGHF